MKQYLDQPLSQFLHHMTLREGIVIVLAIMTFILIVATPITREK